MLIKKCLVCSAEYQSFPSSHRKYCSQKCTAKAVPQTKSGATNPAWRGGKIRKYCLLCNKEFFIWKAETKRGGGKFDSIKCSSKWKSLTYIQEKSNFWRGGVATINNKIRTSIQYRMWRNKILTRDDYTCKICKQKGGKLNVDHFPKTLAKIIHENINLDFKTLLNYKILWDLNNGRTLCEKCHKNTPTYLKNIINLTI